MRAIVFLTAYLSASAVCAEEVVTECKTISGDYTEIIKWDLKAKKAEIIPSHGKVKFGKVVLVRDHHEGSIQKKLTLL